MKGSKMRKFVLVLVALLAMPVLAVDPNIYLQAGDEPGEVEIWYNRNDGNLPSGLGLTVTVSAGTITAVDELSAVYNIYPGQIVIVDGNVTDYNTPVASGLGTGTVVLEFGALYERGVDTPPANSAKLCSVTVSTTCTVTVTGDDDRAGVGMGIVAENYVAYPVSASLGVTLSTDCLSNSAPYYSKWTSFGKPDCFCYRKQCAGDANGGSVAGRPVTSADLVVLQNAYNKSTATLLSTYTAGICADFNKTDVAGRPVTSADLVVLQGNYNKAGTLIAECDGTYILQWKN
jgi:hypothetical protein